jgi:hypothetical protein
VEAQIEVGSPCMVFKICNIFLELIMGNGNYQQLGMYVSLMVWGSYSFQTCESYWFPKHEGLFM